MGSSRGELIRWARTQRGMSMQDVADHGGPAPAYQSNVENGKRWNVSKEQLSVWVAILDVPEHFINGDYAPFDKSPEPFCHLCQSARPHVITLMLTSAWLAMTAGEKFRQILQLIVRRLTLPGAAYCLGLDMPEVTEFLSGGRLVPTVVIDKLLTALQLDRTAVLEALPVSELIALYAPILPRIAEMGVSPDELLALVAERHRRAPAERRPDTPPTQSP